MKFQTMSDEKRTMLVRTGIVALCAAGALALGNGFAPRSLALSLISAVLGGGASLFAADLFLMSMERFGGPGLRAVQRKPSLIEGTIRIALGAFLIWSVFSSSSEVKFASSALGWFMMATLLWSLMPRGSQGRISA